jgi:hypothetical protein
LYNSGLLKSFFHTEFALVRRNYSSVVSLQGKCAFHWLFFICMKVNRKLSDWPQNGATAFSDISFGEGEENLQSYLLLISEF